MDANCRPLVLEATALPTEPQPQPHKHYFVSKHLPIELRWDKSFEINLRPEMKIYVFVGDLMGV